MSYVKKVLLFGPLYIALSGERKKALMRQWKIAAAIFVTFSLISCIILLVKGNTTGIFKFLLVALGLQLVYAVIREETIIQLRYREYRYRSEDSAANTNDLVAFADSLKKAKQ